MSQAESTSFVSKVESFVTDFYKGVARLVAKTLLAVILFGLFVAFVFSHIVNIGYAVCVLIYRKIVSYGGYEWIYTSIVGEPGNRGVVREIIRILDEEPLIQKPPLGETIKIVPQAPIINNASLAVEDSNFPLTLFIKGWVVDRLEGLHLSFKFQSIETTLYCLITLSIIYYLYKALRKLPIRGLSSFIQKNISGIEYIPISYEAMIDGSEFVGINTFPKNQIAIYQPGLIRKLFVGYGLRIKSNVMAMPRHVYRFVQEEMMLSNPKLNKVFSISGFRVVPSMIATDLVYIEIPDEVFSKLEISVPKFAKVINGQVANVNGPQGSSAGMISKNYVMGLLNYAGSTMPGYSGASYHINGKMIGMHIGCSTDTGKNLGIAASAIGLEAFKFFPDNKAKVNTEGSSTFSTPGSERDQFEEQLGMKKEKQMWNDNTLERFLNSKITNMDAGDGGWEDEEIDYNQKLTFEGLADSLEEFSNSDLQILSGTIQKLLVRKENPNKIHYKEQGPVGNNAAYLDPLLERIEQLEETVSIFKKSVGSDLQMGDQFVEFRNKTSNGFVFATERMNLIDGKISALETRIEGMDNGIQNNYVVATATAEEFKITKKIVEEVQSSVAQIKLGDQLERVNKLKEKQQKEKIARDVFACPQCERKLKSLTGLEAHHLVSHKKELPQGDYKTVIYETALSADDANTVKPSGRDTFLGRNSQRRNIPYSQRNSNFRDNRPRYQSYPNNQQNTESLMKQLLTGLGALQQTIAGLNLEKKQN